MSLPAPAPVRSSPTLRALLMLAWPLVVSRSSQVVVGLCDALMVADLGEAALAATTTGALNAYVLLILPMGTVFIVSSFSSQLLGGGDLAGARRYGFYGLGVAAATEVLCLASIPLVAPALGLFPYSGEVSRLMADYLECRLLCGGAVVGIEALGNYYGGLGNTRLPMRVNVLVMALNVAGNWVLIHGNLGAPALGVRGAAIASSLSTTAGFAVLLGRFLLDGRRMGTVGPRRHVREMVRMLRFGLPVGLNWFFEFLAFCFFSNVVVAGLGTTALAAMMAVIQINSVSFMPAFGVASAGAILVGQAIGASAKEEVPRILGLTFLTAGSWQGLVGLAYLGAPRLLLVAFVASGAEGTAFLEVGIRMLMLSAAWQLFDAAANTLAESLRAAGDTAFTLWARTILGWLVFAPGSWLSVRYLGWGEVGAVAWLVVWLALLAAVLYLRFRSGAWRRHQLTEPAPEAWRVGTPSEPQPDRLEREGPDPDLEACPVADLEPRQPSAGASLAGAPAGWTKRSLDRRGARHGGSRGREPGPWLVTLPATSPGKALAPGRASSATPSRTGTSAVPACSSRGMAVFKSLTACSKSPASAQAAASVSMYSGSVPRQRQRLLGALHGPGPVAHLRLRSRRRSQATLLWADAFLGSSWAAVS